MSVGGSNIENLLENEIKEVEAQRQTLIQALQTLRSDIQFLTGYASPLEKTFTNNTQRIESLQQEITALCQKYDIDAKQLTWKTSVPSVQSEPGVIPPPPPMPANLNGAQVKSTSSLSSGSASSSASTSPTRMGISNEALTDTRQKLKSNSTPSSPTSLQAPTTLTPDYHTEENSVAAIKQMFSHKLGEHNSQSAFQRVSPMSAEKKLELLKKDVQDKIASQQKLEQTKQSLATAYLRYQSQPDYLETQRHKISQLEAILKELHQLDQVASEIQANLARAKAAAHPQEKTIEAELASFIPSPPPMPGNGPARFTQIASPKKNKPLIQPSPALATIMDAFRATPAYLNRQKQEQEEAQADAENQTELQKQDQAAQRLEAEKKQQEDAAKLKDLISHAQGKITPFPPMPRTFSKEAIQQLPATVKQIMEYLREKAATELRLIEQPVAVSESTSTAVIPPCPMPAHVIPTAVKSPRQPVTLPDAQKPIAVPTAMPVAAPAITVTKPTENWFKHLWHKFVGGIASLWHILFGHHGNAKVTTPTDLHTVNRRVAASVEREQVAEQALSQKTPTMTQQQDTVRAAASPQTPLKLHLQPGKRPTPKPRNLPS